MFKTLLEKRSTQIILLAVTYFITGRAGLLFALPPGYATLFWPPFGLSIAALLLFGTNRWPGVLIGAFLVNLKSLTLDIELAAVVGVALGNTLSVFIGAHLIKRALSYPKPFYLEKDIFLFLSIAGPVAATVSSTSGVTILYFLGILYKDDLSLNWIYWFAGDATGGVIFAPLALIFSIKSRPYWLKSIPKVLIPLFLFWGGLIGALQYVNKVERGKIHSDFVSRSTLAVRLLERNISSYQTRLDTLRSFFENSQVVTAQEFTNFTKSLFSNRPEMHTLAWFPLSPTGPLEFSALYAEQSNPTINLVGQNLAHNLEIQQFLERAIKEQKAVASGTLDLQFFGTQEPSIALATPVSKPKGVLLKIIKTSEVLKGMADIVKDPSYRVVIEDVSKRGSPPVLVIDSLKSHKNDRTLHPIHALTMSSQIYIEDQLWRVTITQDLALNADSTLRASVLSLVPLLLTFLACSVLLMIVSRIITIEKIVDDKTMNLRDLNTQLEKTSRVKSEFLANMSHEIRTPLNVLIGMADLLEDSSLNEEQKRYIDISRKAGDNLLNIINDILDISKIEAGLITLEKMEVDIPALVRDVAEMFSLKCREKRLALSLNILLDTNKIYLGDPTRIRQILSNLIANAIKFTEKGGIQIKVSPNVDKALPGNLLFEVIDSGIGIPPDKMNLLFQPFTQADTTVTRKYGGTGLGLSISKRLVEMMKGQIQVQSDTHRGSTFRFTLDLPPVRKESLQKIQKETVPPPTEFSDGKALRILIVDDTEDNRALVRAFLRNTPHTLFEAENGQRAVADAKEKNLDLILMDMQMPVMDGCQATQEIRKWERETGRSPMQIWALTAYAMKNEINKSIEAGCNLHLIKPIRRLDFLRHISEFSQAQKNK